MISKRTKQGDPPPRAQGSSRGQDRANRAGTRNGALIDLFSETLRSTTGLLLLLAPLITAGWGVWYALAPRPAIRAVEEPKPVAPEPAKVAALATERDIAKKNPEIAACVVLDPKFTSIMPLSLTNAIGTNTYPYWFRLEVDNQCSQRISLAMTWKIKQVPSKPVIRFASEADKPLEVEPGKRGGKNYNLGLELASDDFPHKMNLTVSWSVLNEQQIRLQNAEAEITLLPPDVYKWDLISPTGKAVPNDFVLASLANWVTTPSDKKDFVSAAIKASLGTKLKAENWIERAYQALFGGAHPIEVAEGGSEFPPDEPRRILAPQEVLRTMQGDALEVALTVAAVTYNATDRGAKIALFILPDSTISPPQMAYLLGWEAAPGTWRAIDISHANSQSFSDNARQASERLAAVMSKALREDFDRFGVFADERNSLFALDFHAVHLNPEYRIVYLPTASSSELTVSDSRSTISKVPNSPYSAPGSGALRGVK